MSTESAVESPKTVAECREEMRMALESFDAAKPERIGSPSLEDCVRQGDVYLVCVDKLPEGKPSKERQLVSGTTQGARHVLQGDVDIVTKYQFKDIPEVLIGPAFHCKGEVVVDHPEHRNMILPEGSTWVTIGQQASSDEIKRVAD